MSDTELELGEEVYRNVLAGDPGQWIHSVEQEEALEEIVEAMNLDEFPVIVRWDAAQGMRVFVSDGAGRRGWAKPHEDVSFEAAMDALPELGAPTAGSGGERKRVVCVFFNLQLQLAGGAGPMRAQRILNYLHWAASTQGRQRMVVLSTVVSPPEILAAGFTKVTHRLPSRERLRDLLYSMATEEGDLPDEPEEVEAILDAARGLTRRAAMTAFSRCLSSAPGYIAAEPIFERKARFLKGNDLGLSIAKPQAAADEVVGHNEAKRYYRAVMSQRAKLRKHSELRPRGVILAGVSGGGKSMLAYALGGMVSPARPTVKWERALAGSKFVSEGAEKMHKTLEIFEQLAPCNILVDEGGKAMLASVSDHGGGSRVQAGEQDSLWLDWQQTTHADAYPIITMNEEFDILYDRMPEYMNRFDRVYFVDYPTEAQLDQIFIYHMRKYRLIEAAEEYHDLKQRNQIPETKWWVGRDVDNVCRQAALCGTTVLEESQGLEKDDASETAKRMREAAVKHCLLSSEYAGRYRPEQHERLVLEAVGGASRDAVRTRRKKRRVATDG